MDQKNGYDIIGEISVWYVEPKEVQTIKEETRFPAQKVTPKEKTKNLLIILRPSFNNNANAMTDEWCIDHKGEWSKRIQKLGGAT